MILHAKHAAQHGHHKILICTIDTDVVVLAMMIAATLSAEHELWLAFGKGKTFQYLAAHKVATVLGPEKSQGLPMFHALTGCDTVSAFVGHGKKTAWSLWNSFPQLTDNLVRLAHGPPVIPEECMNIIKRFVVLIYDCTSTCSDVNKARKRLFAKTLSVQRIPPSHAGLHQHVKRAVFQGGYVWGQTLIPHPMLPSPTSRGWTRLDNGMCGALFQMHLRVATN